MAKSNPSGETVKGIFGIIIFLAIGFVIFKACTRPSVYPPPKNEIHCAQYIYFNSGLHKMDTIYSPITMFDDSIVNITTPQGKVFWAKDFVDKQSIIIDETDATDLTISDGSRYKVIPLDRGKCQSKIKMDSIRNTYSNDNNGDSDDN